MMSRINRCLPAGTLGYRWKPLLENTLDCHALADYARPFRVLGNPGNCIDGAKFKTHGAPKSEPALVALPSKAVRNQIRRGGPVGQELRAMGIGPPFGHGSGRPACSFPASFGHVSVIS